MKVQITLDTENEEDKQLMERMVSLFERTTDLLDEISAAEEDESEDKQS